MYIFIDSADVKSIREIAISGLVDGVTTNPSLIAKNGQDIKKTLKEICEIVSGSVSAEVTGSTYDEMMEEAQVLLKIASNITIKVPLTFDGLRACRELTRAGHTVNVTLCFSLNQALLAAKAGATYISPFIGRLDDLSYQGLDLIRNIRLTYNHYSYLNTKILAASIRHPLHVAEVAKLGADVITIPPALFKQLYCHPLTEQGIQQFTEDWKKTGQSIL